MQTRRLFCLIAALAGACGEHEPSAAEEEDRGPISARDAGGEGDTDDTDDAGVEPGDAGQPQPSQYVLVNEIYAADDSTTYVNILDDLAAPSIDLDDAAEFAGGRATVQAFAGWVFVAPPKSTVVQRYAVSEDGKLSEDGEIGFGNFGFHEVVIDEWANTFVSPTKAYLLNLVEGETVIWNPTTMEIEGTVDHGDLDLVRAGWTLDTSPAVVRGDRLLRAFYWNNWDAYAWSEDVLLAVYDVETDTLIDSVRDTRCPALGNRVSRDEAGNLYFSNWVWNVGATLVKDAPPSCVLRVNAGEETFDPSWSLRYSEVADGHEGAMFAYLGGGKALISAFHDERVEIQADTDASALLSTDNWRLWTVDLETRESAPLEGLGWNTGAISHYQLDGRSFVFVPGADWAITRIHEISDGRAEHSFDVQGWSYQFFKIR